MLGHPLLDSGVDVGAVSAVHDGGDLLLRAGCPGGRMPSETVKTGVQVRPPGSWQGEHLGEYLVGCADGLSDQFPQLSADRLVLRCPLPTVNSSGRLPRNEVDAAHSRAAPCPHPNARHLAHLCACTRTRRRATPIGRRPLNHKPRRSPHRARTRPRWAQAILEWMQTHEADWRLWPPCRRARRACGAHAHRDAVIVIGPRRSICIPARVKWGWRSDHGRNRS